MKTYSNSFILILFFIPLSVFSMNRHSLSEHGGAGFFDLRMTSSPITPHLPALGDRGLSLSERLPPNVRHASPLQRKVNSRYSVPTDSASTSFTSFATLALDPVFDEEPVAAVGRVSPSETARAEPVVLPVIKGIGSLSTAEDDTLLSLLPRRTPLRRTDTHRKELTLTQGNLPQSPPSVVARSRRGQRLVSTLRHLPSITEDSADSEAPTSPSTDSEEDVHFSASITSPSTIAAPPLFSGRPPRPESGTVFSTERLTSLSAQKRPQIKCCFPYSLELLDFNAGENEPIRADLSPLEKFVKLMKRFEEIEAADSSSDIDSSPEEISTADIEELLLLSNELKSTEGIFSSSLSLENLLKNIEKTEDPQELIFNLNQILRYMTKQLSFSEEPLIFYTEEKLYYKSLLSIPIILKDKISREWSLAKSRTLERVILRYIELKPLFFAKWNACVDDIITEIGLSNYKEINLLLVPESLDALGIAPIEVLTRKLELLVKADQPKNKPPVFVEVEAPM